MNCSFTLIKSRLKCPELARKCAAQLRHQRDVEYSHGFSNIANIQSEPPLPGEMRRSPCGPAFLSADLSGMSSACG